MPNTNHPINGLLDTSMQNLRSLVDANTVVGEAINTPDGTTIIPVSKVSFGFASGGSDIPGKDKEPFGVSVLPIAFLIIKDGKVDLLQINESKNTADRIVNMVPEMFDKMAAFLKKDKTAPAAEPNTEDELSF